MSAEQPTPEDGAGLESVAEQRKRLPDQPGVYVFADERGKVMYVGKARSIRKRVGGHFSRTPSRGARR